MNPKSFIRHTIPLILLVWLTIFWHHQTYAQSKNTKATSTKPTEAEDEFDYNEEFDYGINFNTNSRFIGGLFLKYSRRSAANPNRYTSYVLEIVGARHPKETRWPSVVTGNYFTPNKLNYLFVVRPIYGREWILFRKAPEQGVHINAFVGAGPSFGLVKPYYISYTYNSNPDNPVSEAYNPTKHPNIELIQGPGSFLQGFDAMQVRLGGNLKTALSFEFGRFSHSVVGVEVGLLAEVYTSKIPLMAQAPNKFAFTSAFLTLYYGNKY